MKLRRNNSRLLVIVAIVSVIAAACGSGSKGKTAASSSNTTSSGQPQMGGTLTMAYQFEPATIDLLHQGGVGVFTSSDAYQTYAIFDALAYEDPVTGDLHMRTAESITSPDATVWTLKLKPNIKFSDGTPYDAAAVKFNYERHQNPANKSAQASSANLIASMEIVDPQTLKITLKSPDGQFPRVIARNLPFIGSPKAIQDMGDKYGAAPVGAGPFTVKEWVNGGHMTLVKNPTYWDAPRPYVDQLIFQIVTDAEQRYNTFTTGQANMMSAAIFPELAQRAKKAGQQALEVDAPIGGEGFWINTKSPAFTDLKARRALAAALDYQKMIDTVFAGLKKYSPNIIRQPSPFYDASLVQQPFDPKLAQQLLDELFAQTGKDLTFTMSVSTNSKPEGEFFQAQLTQFKHINPKVEVVANGDFASRYAKKDFDMIVGAPGGYDPDPGLYQQLYSTSPQNITGYSNPELDTALTTGVTSLDPKARAAAYKTVQQIITRDIPLIVINEAPGFLIYNNSVQNVTAAAGFPRWEQMWIKK